MKTPTKIIKSNSLEQRCSPQQQRSHERIDKILEVTARLLGEVGLDDLTTVLVARELGISVGSVYHYYPNKFAILYAVGECWLEEMTKVLEAIEDWDLKKMGVSGFVDQYCEEMLSTYRLQIGVLPLVQVMFTVPELRELDKRHDEEIIKSLADVFLRLGFKHEKAELHRVGLLILEISHALFLVIVEQNKTQGARTLSDLKSMLNRYLSDTKKRGE